MKNTDKSVCREIAALLLAHGIKHVVLCPGSRNAPLSIAIARCAEINHRVVVDERCAAFVALGMAIESGDPVAVVLTSGSAILNAAPAVAEAFYRKAPLILISADRPCDLIDQDDSQTIRQLGVLDNFVKMSVDIPVEDGSQRQARMINRKVNDALTAALYPSPGPVHINVQLDTPLGNEVEVESCPVRKIDVVRPGYVLSTSMVRNLTDYLMPPRKVMIVCGFMAPDSSLNAVIGDLSRLPNVAVIAEAQSNLRCRRAHYGIDAMLAAMSEEQRRSMQPDVLITLGGALVSVSMKQWLRSADDLSHWSIDDRQYAVDTYGHLERRIDMPPVLFLKAISAALAPYANATSNYAANWENLSLKVRKCQLSFVSQAPWSDFTAVSAMFKMMPRHSTLHVSNGTAIRYVQYCERAKGLRVECNRGVSGIDGCTSTAIGAAMLNSQGPTFLITGDMSAQYDIGALAVADIPASFKMVVLSNGGGNIFRLVKTTRDKAETESLFAADVRLPLKSIAEAYGFEYFESSDYKELRKSFKMFAAELERPAILEIKTDGPTDIKVLEGFFDRLKQ